MRNIKFRKSKLEHRKSIYKNNEVFIYPPHSEKPFIKKEVKENKTDQSTKEFEEEYMKFINELKEKIYQNEEIR